MSTRILRASVVAAAVALVASFTAPAGATAPVRSFEVTITNLTSGQPLTPPVVATHRGGYRMFKVGALATEGVQQVAENGNGAPLLQELAASKHVSGFLQTGTGPLMPEGLPGSAMFEPSVTFGITAGPGASRLSWVSMLVCTNDGFTGRDTIPLPKQVGASATFLSKAYDAGTEVNTEDFADIVPPCQEWVGVSDPSKPGTGMTDPALAEGGVIHHHQGVLGIADLVPAIHGWDTSAPVAMLRIERIG